MAKQSINVGTAANDKKGDSLRAAFVKVNANFTELYAALGLTDVTLNLGAFTFTGSTMSTDDSTNIVIDKPITVNGEITVDGDITPKTNLGASLGTPTKQFKSLYVSNSTIYIGGTAVGVDANGNLTTNGTALTSDRLVNGDYELVVETDGIISSVAFPERDGGKIYLSGVEFGAIPSDPADTAPVPLVLTSQQGNVRISSKTLGPRFNWEFDTDGRTIFPNGAVPAHSYGAAGDLEGMVVFTDPYIYYCKEDFRSLDAYTAAVSTNGGSTFEVYQDGTPIIGDRLYGGTVGVNTGGVGRITNVQASTEGGQPTWLLTVTQIGGTSIGLTANQSCTIGTPDIWVRVAWTGTNW
jgi:hypothetical protein